MLNFFDFLEYLYIEFDHDEDTPAFIKLSTFRENRQNSVDDKRFYTLRFLSVKNRFNHLEFLKVDFLAGSIWGYPVCTNPDFYDMFEGKVFDVKGKPYLISCTLPLKEMHFFILEAV